MEVLVPAASRPLDKSLNTVTTASILASGGASPDRAGTAAAIRFVVNTDSFGLIPSTPGDYCRQPAGCSGFTFGSSLRSLAASMLGGPSLPGRDPSRLLSTSGALK